MISTLCMASCLYGDFPGHVWQESSLLLRGNADHQEGGGETLEEKISQNVYSPSVQKLQINNEMNGVERLQTASVWALCAGSLQREIL